MRARAQLVSGARNIGVELVQFEAQTPDEIGRALDAIAVAKSRGCKRVGFTDSECRPASQRH